MGAQEERLFVEYDNSVLSKLGMTPKMHGARSQSCRM